MLELGIPLSSSITELPLDETNGTKVLSVDNDYLIACFDKNITEQTVKHIAKKKPYYFVMCDSSMENDSLATSFEEIFASYSKETKLKVL